MDIDVWISATLFAGSFFAASVSDIRTREIPDRCSLGVLAAGMVRIWAGRAEPLPSLGSLLTVGGLLLAASLWRDGLGGGDVKLAGAAAFVVGARAAFTALALSMTAALAFVLVRRAFRPALGEAAALAPFLMAGFCHAYCLLR